MGWSAWYKCRLLSFDWLLGSNRHLGHIATRDYRIGRIVPAVIRIYYIYDCYILYHIITYFSIILPKMSKKYLIPGRSCFLTTDSRSFSFSAVAKAVGGGSFHPPSQGLLRRLTGASDIAYIRCSLFIISILLYESII